MSFDFPFVHVLSEPLGTVGEDGLGCDVTNGGVEEHDVAVLDEPGDETAGLLFVEALRVPRKIAYDRANPSGRRTWESTLRVFQVFQPLAKTRCRSLYSCATTSGILHDGWAQATDG